MSQYSSLTSVLLALFFFFELAFTASIRARAVYCCSNVSHTSSSESSASDSSVGTECSFYLPSARGKSVLECIETPMYCNPSESSVGNNGVVNCVPAE